MFYIRIQLIFYSSTAQVRHLYESKHELLVEVGIEGLACSLKI